MESGIVFDQVVGAVLRKYREMARLNQNEAVSGTSISVSSLSRLEVGDYSLNMEQLLELANRYGVTMTQITKSIEDTYNNARNKGVRVENQKKSNAGGLLLLGAAAIAALVIAKNSD